jgi:hypothetical protein
VNVDTFTGERIRWQSAGNFNDTNETGVYSVLGMAVCFNKPEMVEFLLKEGADASRDIEVNGNQRTLLSIAKSRNMKKIIKLLSK